MNGAAATTAASGRCLVVHPELRGGERPTRSPEARLEEAVGLAEAIDLEVCEAIVLPTRARAATLLGRGHVETIRELVEKHEAELVVVDAALTPVQQRNLERAWKAKVIDRTGLILEIFGKRARTREGRLQVELAQLSYRRTRLVRSWTHLERQRGGLGAVGGPGESQLEIDRRLIDQRIDRLKVDLKDVARTRALHRKRRRDAPWPVVALVGYTNAGKSTLFNRLAHAHVLSRDMLFATLDPTMRAVDLGPSRRVILSDTVGFISDLPTHLIAAFRATLEEVLEASLILHVRDAAHPDSEAQARDVYEVLDDLGLSGDRRGHVIEVLNKADLVDPSRRPPARHSDGQGDAVWVSAATGEGCDDLIRLIDARLSSEEGTVTLDVPHEAGAAIAWLYRNGRVLSRTDDEDVAHLVVGMDAAGLARFQRNFPGLAASG